MRHLIAAVALLGVVGSKPPWRTPTPQQEACRIPVEMAAAMFRFSWRIL
jgi:hypothetical protein